MNDNSAGFKVKTAEEFRDARMRFGAEMAERMHNATLRAKTEEGARRSCLRLLFIFRKNDDPRLRTFGNCNGTRIIM